MRNLRGAQRGYRYQDILAEKVVCWALSIYVNPTFIIDEKDNLNDYIEDIKVIVGEKKDCFQIKHSNNRRLSIDDFKTGGELSLSRLNEYDKSQNDFSSRYFFLLKWEKPTDKLANLIIEDELQIFHYKNTKYYKFNLDLLNIICSEMNIEINSQTIALLNKIHILCEMPESSCDFTNPLELENNLFESISNIGIGRFPNDFITPKQFAINLFNELNFYRSDSISSITASDLLKKLCICVDFGKLNETPNINEEILISDEEDLDLIFNSINNNERTLLVGEPGSGKTYFSYSLEKLLSSHSINYTKHYFYIDTSDNDLVKRSKGDYLIGNLLLRVYEQYPGSKKEGLSLSASIDDLNLALSTIRERLVVLIDGVDHAFRNYLDEKDNELIDLINRIVTNDYVHIVLISQPLSHLEKLDNFNKYSIKKWDKNNIKMLAHKKNIELNDDVIDSINEKGQGNPLYINYLLNNIEDLNNTPVYDGDIKNYYSYLIKNSNSKHLFQYLISIPFSFTEYEFSAISNSGTIGMVFIQKNIFLLKYDNIFKGYRIYHESLIRFLFDYCDSFKIDLIQTKKNVVAYLKQRPFYSDFKAYNYTNQLCFEVGDIDSILSYISYDFISKSLFYGHCLKEINNNVGFFRKAICQKESFELYEVYLLMKKCLDVYYDEDFTTEQSPDYFLAFLSVMGEAGVESLMMHNYSPKTANLIYYSAAVDGIASPTSFMNDEANYSQFERDFYLSNLVIKHFFDKKTIKLINSDLPFSQKLEIVRTTNELEKIQDLFHDEDEDIKSLLNLFYFDPLCKIKSNRIRLDFERNYYKEDFAKILCDFVSSVNCEFIDHNLEQTILDLQEHEFIFAVFRLVLDNHRAYKLFKKNNNKKLFEETIVKNIISFKNRVDPFKGEPRACDFTSPEFRYVFINILLLPLKYLDEAKEEYFKEVLSIKDKLETSVRGAVMSCISLDDILDNIKVYLNNDNMSIILKTLESDITKSFNYQQYAYSAGFCYKLSRLFKNFDRKKQLEFYEKGISYSLCYGGHKDIFFEEIIDSFAAVQGYLASPTQDLIEIGDMAYALDYHTDGKETKWFFLDWIRFCSEKYINECSNYICHKRLNYFYHWKIDIGVGILIEYIYDKISSKTLFFLLTSNQLDESHFDYDIYYFCLKRLIKEKNRILSYQLLTYLNSVKKEFERNASFVHKLNSIIIDEKFDFQTFEIETEQYINKEIKSQSISHVPLLHEINSIDKYLLSDVANAIINAIPLQDCDKSIIEKLFHDYRYHSDLSELCDLVLNKVEGDLDKAYFYALSFFYCRDGWDKAYVNADYFAKGLEKYQNLFVDNLFCLIERNPDVWRGLAGICKGLALNPKTKEQSIAIWKSIKDFAEKRLPDCNHEVDTFQFVDSLSMEDIGLNLLLSGLNDYSSNNHKNILRFINTEIQEQNDLVIKWVFKNWNRLKLFTKLDILSILLNNNFDFKTYSESWDLCIKNDASILSRTLLSGIKNGKVAKEITPLPYFIGNEEQYYCYLHLFKYRGIHDFCVLNGINVDIFLKSYKETIGSKQAINDYKLFYSASELRPVDNFYRYNSFLEVTNEFFDGLVGRVKEDDLFNVFFTLLPLDESVCTKFFGPLLNDPDTILLASYKASEPHKEFSKTKQLKVEKDISITQFESKGKKLLLNNIDSICNAIMYDHQIEFTFLPEIIAKYNIKCRRNSGDSVYYIGNEIVAFFQTIRSNLKGIEYYHDRYYLTETGFFYIKRTFLNKICNDFEYADLNETSDTKKMIYFG